MSIATATIDCQALTHNFQQIKKMAPESAVVAVVKADAYGHGVEKIAKQLDPYADYIAVARLDEAIALRTVGISKPIIVLDGLFSAADVPLLTQYQLQTTIGTEEQLMALLTDKRAINLTVWLKIDTGMHRLGVHPSQVNDFYHRLQASD